MSDDYFYADILRIEESEETQNDKLILAAYAPLSIVYTVWVLSYLASLLGNWVVRFWDF